MSTRSTGPGLDMKTSSFQRLSARSSRARTAIAQALQALEDRSLQREKVQVAESKKIAKAMRALQSPFEQQVAESPAAARALKELRQFRVKGITAEVPHLVARDQANTAVLSLHLQEHLSFAIPPYDYDWQRGNPFAAKHNRLKGTMSITGESGHFAGGASGRVDAAAGIGLLLTTDRPASVSVRPFITYAWQSVVGAGGLFSSGEANGGIDAAAFLNGAVIAGVRRSELFSKSRGWAGSERDDGGGIAWVPDLTLVFNMNPGQVVAVSFGAYVECDHNNGIGFGAGGGGIGAKVNWIVVERFVA